jgi:hypothetical protein
MAFHPVTHASRRSTALLAALWLIACGGDDKAPAAPDAGAQDGASPVMVDAGGAPATPPEGESLCKTGPCNYQTQEGCGTGESCLPELRNGAVAPSCQAAGAKQSGESCTGWNDCATGLFCAEGACRKLCCGGDWSACPAGESCIRQLLVRDRASMSDVPAGADLCFPVGTCNVLDPRACSDTPGRGCKIVDPAGNVACAPSESAGPGDGCETGRACRTGSTCVGGTCRRLCGSVDSVTVSCPAGEGTCVHYTRDPPGVGECTP